MKPHSCLIRRATIIDGSGQPPYNADVAIRDGRISAIDTLAADHASADHVIDAAGKVLAPGFIDVHTHDDSNVVSMPQMLPKLSQGITTVVVGNCGISVAPVTLHNDPPDPMNLLGTAEVFRYPRFADYVAAVDAAEPAVNVGALVGHTALRNNHMDRLDRAATPAEIDAMRRQLRESLDDGALGLSSGLAYFNAIHAPTDEVVALARELTESGGVYTTHLRSEAAAIMEALDEAFAIGQQNKVPVVVSHLKCAGIDNWGRIPEVLAKLDEARAHHPVGCDCYPYAAGSSTLDLGQVTDRTDILITWSEPHPEMARRPLRDIAADWGLDLMEAAARLQPAGAVYFSISEDDMRQVITHPATMIGSDGLPNDPFPHPRLWGAFPRVIGHYGRDLGLLTLPEAVHKMTGLSARRFGLDERGLIQVGYHADLVLFDPATIRDAATFSDPCQCAHGIESVWVNGVESYTADGVTGHRAGRFLRRGKIHTALPY